MNATGAQDAVTRNVRVLMAMRQIDEQQQMAELLGWNASKLSRTLNGGRKWQIEDLIWVGTVFNIEPGLLLGNTATLAGAIAPTGTASNGGVTEITRRYSAFSVPPISAEPQVGAVILPFRQRHTNVTQTDASEWRNKHAAG